MIASSSLKPQSPPAAEFIPDASVIQLLSILEEMIQIHQQFLALLQREKRLMIEGNIEDLNRLLNEKEAMLGELNQLEERRRKEIDPLSERLRQGAQHGRPEKDQSLTLKQLINHVSGPNQARLRSCHVRLEALTASVLEINQINGILIDRTLRQITGLLGLLRHLALAPSTYQPTGLLSDSPTRGRTIGKG